MIFDIKWLKMMTKEQFVFLFLLISTAAKASLICCCPMDERTLKTTKPMELLFWCLEKNYKTSWLN
jgi:hypothetical protein